MTETMNIDKKAIFDLIRIKEEFDSVVESIELINNKEFMDSYKKSREHVGAGLNML